MNPSQLNITIALLLLFNVPQAVAEDVNCMTLKDAIAASKQDFAAFRGARRDLPPDPELAELGNIKDFSYKRDEYATERLLAAAVSCSVIVARAEDPESIINEARFECIWPSAGKSPTQFATIKRALQGCSIAAQAEEDDADSYTFNIDQPESGEGWSGTTVLVERQSESIDAGVSVSVIHAVCQTKNPSGCDDAL